MLGYTYEEAVDTFGPIDTAYPEDKKIVEENIRRRLTGEADHIEYDFRTVRKDGKVLNMKVLGSLTIYKGRTAVTGNIIDITREKTLESQLLQAQKMEAIGTLAGGIAHDFNNILTAVIGYGRLLQMKMDDTDPLKAYVAHILSSQRI
jgi:PAS domain S-box-containing protein